MTNATIAQRYALSLVQLGAQTGLVDNFRRELADMDALFTANPDLSAVFANPALSHQQKHGIMAELISASNSSELVGNLLLLLVDKNRTGLLSQIARAYQSLADQHLGILRPAITTAFSLDDSQLAAIRDSLKHQNATTVIPRVTVDSTLLGGLVIQIGDTIFDSSVKTQLSRIQDHLQKG